VEQTDADRRFHLRPSWQPVQSSLSIPKRASASSNRAGGDKDVFVHISAMERAGMSTLNEGQKVSYDVVSERGKLAAASLQAV
jgi:cold shock CspA family protein